MLEDLWVTILEGGSNYWVDKIDYDKPEGMLFKDDLPSLKSGAHLAENFEVTVYHGADEWSLESIGETVKVKTFDVIHKGISLLSDDVKTVIMNNGDWDGE